MNERDFNNIINDVHAGIYDWCKEESTDNFGFSELLRGCNHVISEITKRMEMLAENTSKN